MNQNVLIIKTGATGDVVRTTVLLHILKHDNVTWITARKNAPVLPCKHPALREILAIEDLSETHPLSTRVFDIIVSLDDDPHCAMLAGSLKTKQLIGTYATTPDSPVQYTDNSASWFDMSLISRYPKAIADKKKYNGTRSVQSYLYEMLGHTFSGEEYLIPEHLTPHPIPKLIGIEARAGERWPTKRWNGYHTLSEKLKQAGYDTRFFSERDNIEDYIRDIAECSMMITGDTLGMHFALALKIPTVAIFTCTGANEIHDYGRMVKVVSPHLWNAFFKTEYIPQAVESVTQDMVWNAIETLKTKTLTP